MVLPNFISDLNCILLVNTFYKCYIYFFVLEGYLNILPLMYHHECTLSSMKTYNLECIFDSLNHLIPCYNIHIHSLENNCYFLKCVIKCPVIHNAIINSNSPKAWRRHLAPVLLSGLRSLDECISVNASCTCN